MAIINWAPEYSVGVAEIDEQHKKLFELMNRLFTLYSEKKFTKVDVIPIFNELVNYADEHFSTEEHYFNLYNYKQKDQHTALHESYRQKIEELKKAYDNENQASTLFAITNFLNDWWVWHINNADKAYTSYFNANGLK
jgi:hemerythrin-like metal-binding protein